MKIFTEKQIISSFHFHKTAEVMPEKPKQHFTGFSGMNTGMPPTTFTIGS